MHMSKRMRLRKMVAETVEMDIFQPSLSPLSSTTISVKKII